MSHIPLLLVDIATTEIAPEIPPVVLAAILDPDSALLPQRIGKQKQQLNS